MEAVVELEGVGELVEGKKYASCKCACGLKQEAATRRGDVMRPNRCGSHFYPFWLAWLQYLLNQNMGKLVGIRILSAKASSSIIPLLFLMHGFELHLPLSCKFSHQIQS
ncbi:uncharacterized protein LOC141882231 isoform X1 [Acropora palmata]|uniref:uncharacterized protein LOC141882231 isoform X1 n=1 Tax=Acropora palmata TaxID=6131 RepID=UPI003DA15B71